MSADILAEYSSTVAFIVTSAGLAALIWKGISWLNTQQNRKADERIKIEDEKAKVVKADIDSRAKDLKRDQEETASDVKRDVEAKAAIIKEEIAATARVLQKQTEIMNTDLKNAIREVDEKVMRMLADLSKRADMTNGNVRMIRTEIADVQQDVQSLWELVEDTDETAVTHRKDRTMSAAVNRRRKIQQRDRRKKRLQIQSDSDEQEDQKHSY